MALFVVLCVLRAGDCARGQDADPLVQRKARLLSSYLDDRAFAIFRIDVGKMQVASVYAVLTQITGLHALYALPTEEELTRFADRFRKAGGAEVYVVLASRDLQNHFYFIVPIAAGANSVAIQAMFGEEPVKRRFGVESAEPLRGALLAGSRQTLERLRTAEAAERPELARALAAGSDATFQLLLLPAENNRPAAAQLPLSVLNVRPSEPLVRSFAWASIAIDGPPAPRLKITVEAAPGATAQQLHAALNSTLDSVVAQAEVRKNLALVEEIRRIVDWKLTDKTLSLAVDDREGKLTILARGIVQPLVETAAAVKARFETTNQLKRLGLALHNHHDTKKTFPAPAITDQEGKALLSWRVALLPYLENGGRELYEKFQVDEPWDSPHNKPLLAKMPDVYRAPLSKRTEVGHTVYLAPRGAGTLFEGPQGIAIRQITDGTSNTIAVVEVDDEHAVPWTKPDDWELNVEMPTAGLGGHFPGIFHALFCDASVHTLKETIDEPTLRALFTRAGGEVVVIPD